MRTSNCFFSILFSVRDLIVKFRNYLEKNSCTPNQQSWHKTNSAMLLRLYMVRIRLFIHLLLSIFCVWAFLINMLSFPIFFLILATPFIFCCYLKLYRISFYRLAITENLSNKRLKLLLYGNNYYMY